MKRLTTVICAISLLMAQGCTMIVKETRHTGGYPGHLLDERTFNASGSKRLVLLRATIILAMAADMGRATVNGQDADGFAQLLAGAAQEINYAAADLYRIDGVSPCTTRAVPDHGANLQGSHQEPQQGKAGSKGQVAPEESRDKPDTPQAGEKWYNYNLDDACSGFWENFESNLPLIESRIIKVMLAALPADKARKFLQDVTKGNVMGAAWNAIGAAGQIVGGLHIGFARYRSGLEIVASSTNRCKDGVNNRSEAWFRADTMTVVQAAECLGLSKEDLFVNPGEIEGEDLAKGEVKPRAFLMLMRGVAADCVSLNFAGSGEGLAQSRAIRTRACNSIGFRPKPRPFRFKEDSSGETEAPVDEGTVPRSSSIPRLKIFLGRAGAVIAVGAVVRPAGQAASVILPT